MWPFVKKQVLFANIAIFGVESISIQLTIIRLATGND